MPQPLGSAPETTERSFSRRAAAWRRRSRRTGRLDIVVAHAGVRAYGPFLELDPEELAGMMSADAVAEVVMFALTRPRGLRLMTTTFRPMSEGS